MNTMRIQVLLVLFLFAFQPSVRAQLSESERFEVSKSLDISNALIKELTLYYVDTLDIEKTSRSGFDAMLRTLDPYTEYIPAEEMPDFQFQTTGEYGGIGSIITFKDERIIVMDPYEGMPAQQAGLLPGDQLIEIDGVSLEGQNSAFASERLKGLPDTPVQIKFRRAGEDEMREVTIIRKRIHIDPVTYYGEVAPGVGYIYLSSFTTESAQSVKAAISRLKQQHKLQSLILDVRNNGGGVVEDCLSILNYFLPKDQLLLSMRGKMKQMDRTYNAKSQPIEPNIPLAVLVNGRSASASEILAGAIQDLDRGVVIGSRTFGKGLVQSTRPLPYDGHLKLTTSKYYIPSGRSIQAIDYSRRSGSGELTQIPDSLTTVYYTANGRPVRDGGGILPDIVLEEKQLPSILYYLDNNYLFFDFTLQWRRDHPTIATPETFEVTDELYDAFKAFVKTKDFSYDRQSEKALESLKKVMEFEGYLATASDELTALENKLKPDVDRDLDLNRSLIADYLAAEMMKQYYYASGPIRYALRTDAEVLKAIEVLTDQTQYKVLLQPAK